MSIDRLIKLQQENDRAGAEMLIEDMRFARILNNKPVAVSSFNLFQTPEHIANLMANKFDNVSKILEPSAGLGRLYRAMYKRFPDAQYTLVENSSVCMEQLYNSNISAELKQCDFLTIKPVQEYDAIIMNPPFKMRSDIVHIKHALKFLKPGGKLVAICANSYKRDTILKPISDSWEELPAKTFKTTGTNIDTVIITITR